jgi:hypothetical protein
MNTRLTQLVFIMSRNSPDHAHSLPEDVEYTSTLRITLKPFEEHMESALERAEQWDRGEKVPHAVNFHDASRLQRILTHAAWSWSGA